MAICEHVVSSRTDSQVRVKGLSLRGMGYCRGAHVEVTDPDANPAHAPWVFVVSNNEHATLVCKDPVPPPWIQAGARVRILVRLPCGAEGVHVPADGLASAAIPSTVPVLAPVITRITGSVLCMGIDVAWWGGQTGPRNADTRSECLAWATRTDGGWSDLSIKRVDLNESYNPEADPYTPNADPNAATLLAEIRKIVGDESRELKAVIALDAPLLARDRPDLPRPRKAHEEGTKGGVYRECEVVWQKRKRQSSSRWRQIKVLAGALQTPRLKHLVSGLEMLGLPVYRHPCIREIRGVAVECFPNEVIWSAGVLGHAADLTWASLQAYKRLGDKPIRLPSPVFNALWPYTLRPALNAASLDDRTINRWLSSFGQWLHNDGVVTDDPAEGAAGKKFDDAMDSVLSLAAAVGFVEGAAHIHQGAVEDGHIIGPGVRWSGKEKKAALRSPEVPE